MTGAKATKSTSSQIKPKTQEDHEAVKHWVDSSSLTFIPFHSSRTPPAMSSEVIAQQGPPGASNQVPASPGKFSFLLEDKSLADTQLVLKRSVPIPLEGNQKRDAGMEETLLSTSVHATVMCANSPYFKTRLMGSGQVTAGPDGRKVLEERLAPGDVAALQSVLRFMYTEVLDYEHGVSSPAELVTVMRVADQFKVVDCVSACRREFSKLVASDIDLEMLHMVFSIDSVAHDPASFSEMMSAVKERLLELFKDAVEVIRNPTLLTQFLALPFAAVATLLRSDRLVTDSENSVVVLATLWVARGSQGSSCTAEQRKLISSCIRVGLLTPSYLCGVLPNLKWFSFSADAPAAYFQAMQSRLMMSAESKALLQAQGHKKHPSGAASASQPRASTKEQTLELWLEVDEARLAQHLQDGYKQLFSFAVPAGKADSPQAAAADTPPPAGNRGVQVNSESSFFCGYLFGIKLVFGYSGAVLPPPPQQQDAARTSAASAGAAAADAAAAPTRPKARPSASGITPSAAKGAATGAGVPADPAELGFAVTPSVFASYPPGEESLLPLTCPINVCFRCTLEAQGPYGTPFATATFTGGSFMRPGEDSVSSVAVANFFKKVGPAQQDIEAWKPFLTEGKLRLKLSLQGATVE